MPEVFQCQKCGQCCEGRGGIVLTDHDLARLAQFLGLSMAETLEKHTETIAGKCCIATGADGFCLFFRANLGCAVHEAKPDVCRAWPYFRGNLHDKASFELAKEYCPGMDRDVSFEDFRQSGIEYMTENGLFKTGSADMPNALKP